MPQKPGPGIIVLTHSAKEEDLRRARSTPNSQTPDWYAKGGPAVSQWAAGQFPPPCGPVTGQPQVTVLRITIPSHAALHLAVTRSLPNDPFSKK